MSLAMKVLSVLFILLGTAHAQELDSADKMALDSLSTSTVSFTSDLYSELSRSPGNVIFSPLSIHSILTMTSLGARSHTAQQMRQALHLAGTTDTTRAYKQVYQHFKSSKSDKVALELANRIYVKKAVTLNAEFLQESREVFESEAEVVDFTFDAADKINSWVETKTNHKIKDLVSRGDLNANTAMVLVNAVYFKAKWQDKFNEAHTKKKPFHLADGSTTDVRMMEQRREHLYKEVEGSHTQVLELPYKDCNISMVFMLPSVNKSLADLEVEIKQKGLHSFVNNLSEVLVQVLLPKFRVEQKVSLKDTLIKLGMTDMFGSAADFSGLTANAVPLSVSQVAHKAFIDVVEHGTEAAAATAVLVSKKSVGRLLGPPPSVVFNADRPFVFAMYHKTSKQVMFMGRITRP